MIITEQRNNIVEKTNVNEEDSVSMGIDTDSTHLLMQFLSKNIYSDQIGSCVRETVSNAIDSHTKAGFPDKIIYVELKEKSYRNYQFIVKDEGLGLDQDDVDNVISKYLKSTKRSDKNAIGCIGIGLN